MGIKMVLSDSDGNRYEFDDSNIIGQGGMGIVYLGHRFSVDGGVTKVAIKEIKVKTKEIVERAQRESKIQLNHDNLVRMYSFVEHEVDNDGFTYKNYYVISEYLEGVLLDDIIKGKIENRNGIVFPEIQKFYESYLNNRENLAKEIIKAILSGVLALHDRGYLHRDIDPTNIMITSNGGIKLIDFGIAKLLTDVSSSEKKFTTPGAFIGKPEYSAPELIRGDIEHQGYYTDVYAIGILYFQLLTGHLPFEGSRYEIIKQHLNSKMPLKEITNKSISAIIKKATEKDFNKRYATAALFRAAIDNVKENSSRRYWLISSIFILLILVVGFIVFMYNKSTFAPSLDDKTPENIMVNDSIEYEKALILLNSETKDSIEVGLTKMKTLAEKGIQEAILQLVKTYAWIPTDDESVQRKKLLQIEVDAETQMPKSVEINKNAFEWLNKAVQVSDSCDYKCLYWQSFYYLNGIYVNVDMNMAKQLLHKSKGQAINAGDDAFMNKINKTLQQIK